MFATQLKNFRAGSCAAILLAATFASAQAAAPFTNVKDSSSLKPPAGYRVAVVEWEDLECPDCARAFPLVKEVTDRLHVPWVQHDFPLKFHILVVLNYHSSESLPSLGSTPRRAQRQT